MGSFETIAHQADLVRSGPVHRGQSVVVQVSWHSFGDIYTHIYINTQKHIHN